jgi:flagellar basal body-associated protein FliL
MAASAETTESKGKSRFGVIALALLVGLGAGSAGIMFLGCPAAPRVETAKPTVKEVLHLETFTVDLSDPEQKTYLRVGIDLGLDHEIKSGGGAPPNALVRDTILTVLMGLKPADLMSPEGKHKLKEHILQSLRDRAPELGVHEVYFTEFLMQR